MTRVFEFWQFSLSYYKEKRNDCCRGNRDDVRIWNVSSRIVDVHRQKPEKVTVLKLEQSLTITFFIL